MTFQLELEQSILTSNLHKVRTSWKKANSDHITPPPDICPPSRRLLPRTYAPLDIHPPTFAPPPKKIINKG